MAGLGSALGELRSAADGRRNRDKPSGSLRLVSGYLVGFAIIRTGANVYTYFAGLRSISNEADTIATTLAAAAFACLPLIAGLLLSRGRVDAERRLALIPMRRSTRLAMAALGPVAAEAPTLVFAAALPFLAVAPIAAYSVMLGLRTASWFVVMSVGTALALRSTAGMLRRMLPGRRDGGHGRSILFALVLASLFVANPRLAMTGGRLRTMILGGTAIDIGSSGPLRIPIDMPLGAALAATATVFLAFASALAEDIVLRHRPAARLSTLPGLSGLPFDRAAGGSGALWPMFAVVDRKHGMLRSIALAAVLGTVAVLQRAAAVVPFVVAAAVFAVRMGSAFAFIASDSPTTRRLALAPVRPGTTERLYLSAAFILAALTISPLAAASLLSLR